MIISFNKDIYEIIGLTLCVTAASIGISAFIGLASGVFIGSRSFRGKKLLTSVINTLMGLPPVVAGLVVYLFLSRKGPLGSLRLLFTPMAMVIAQVIIISPIITGLSMAAVKLRHEAVEETCRGLGIGRLKTFLMLAFECRYPLVSALLAGYGRAVSEVGAVMLVGGNIEHSTRVMTTAIVLETGKGEYGNAMALGLILLVLSFGINWIVQRFQEGI
ncbi:MAG: ABC transporter permease [Clostridiales bacterium]|nr:ABC transporter permease [Eubacteriales bacterium]MDH7566475.1 ABC transporter permease [Clostridiales bacterium]